MRKRIIMIISKHYIGFLGIVLITLSDCSINYDMKYIGACGGVEGLFWPA